MTSSKQRSWKITTTFQAVFYHLFILDCNMDITLLPPSSILSRHSHLALLPSPFPDTPLTAKHCSRFNTEYGSYPKVPCRRKIEFAAPRNGSSPISHLPDDIVLSIFGFLDWDDLISIRPVCAKWSTLAVTPSLHYSLTLPTIPYPLPSVLRNHLLRSVRHLSLQLFPAIASQAFARLCPSPLHCDRTQETGSLTASLLTLLEAIPPDQLLSLSVPFSAPHVAGAELGIAIERIGSRLELLDLKGSGLVGNRWTEWLSTIGSSGKGLQHLDIGFTSISSLPAPEAVQNLRTLKMASCSYLPPIALAEFLANLPPMIQVLDLSRVDQVTFEALWNMQVVVDGRPTALQEVRVVGIDHLTRRDVRRLKAHWEDQRCDRKPISFPPLKWGYHTPPQRFGQPSPPRSSGQDDRYWQAPMPPTPPRSISPPCNADEERKSLRSRFDDLDETSINIVHSAILESEDEAGYRQFIGEVANAAIPIGLGLGLELEPERQSRATWVEVEP